MPRYTDDSKVYVGVHRHVPYTWSETKKKYVQVPDTEAEFHVGRGYKSSLGAYSSLAKAKQHQKGADHYLEVDLNDAVNPEWGPEELFAHAERLMLKWGAIADEAKAKMRL